MKSGICQLRTWLLGGMVLISSWSSSAFGGANFDGDLDQANKALAILGADVPDTSRRCAGCHSMDPSTLRYWGESAVIVSQNCLAADDPNNSANPMTPMARINCLRSNPDDVNSPFSAGRLGIFAGGVHTDTFKNLFKAAYPDAEWQQQYDGFVRIVQMPASGEPMTAEDFDFVRAWTLEGMPYLREALRAAGDAPKTCETHISPELAAHVARMSNEGWQAKNKEAGMTMFGCPPGAEELACFTLKDAAGVDLFPEAATTSFGGIWAQDMADVKIRILRELSFETSYWMRASADGRFLGNGNSSGDGEWGGMITDLAPQLTRGAAHRDIRVDASYDPGFFPDNSGFVFQGTSQGTGFCRLSILENPATTEINWQAPECSTGSISLYQAVGASLDGSDYVAITGSFEGDAGGGSRSDGIPSASAGSQLTITPIINDGQVFKSQAYMMINAPWLTDWGLSPSNLVAASRVSGVDERGDGKQQGYRFSFLKRTATANGYEFALQDAGTICAEGGKGAFSFDERMYTVYHYVDADDWAELGFASADDPAFRELLDKGSANVYVLDLLNGTSRRVTRMGPGQLAMFPHYRSDGWIYFMVYDQIQNKRFAVATDASIRLSRGLGLQ